MIYIPYKLIRRLIEILFPINIVRYLPRIISERIWACIHGPLKHSRAFPGINREWVAYDVLRRAVKSYQGPMTVSEFGCAYGAFTERLLDFTRILNVTDRVEIFAFDTFEGLPPPKRQS